MPYVPRTSAQQRIASAGAVILVEAALLLVLARGLTMVVNRIEPDRNLPTTNYRDPPKVDPVEETARPPELARPVTQPADTHLIDFPLSTFDPGPLTRSVDPGKGPISDYAPPRRPAFAAHGPRPLANQASWASADDYPPYDLRAGHQGTTRYRLEVGAGGQVTGCSVTASSGWPGLDAATCRLVSARARFAPGNDESGAAVAGGYAGSVMWRIPDE